MNQKRSEWVVEGGMIALHDATQDGVAKVVCEVFRQEEFARIGLVDSIVYATKSYARRKTLLDCIVLSCVANYNRARRVAGLKHLKGIVKGVLARL